MDWEQLRERSLGEVGTTLVAEGAGVTAGFLGAAFVGRTVQNRVKKDADIISTTDKIMAWSANNVPKMVVWYALKKFSPSEPGEVLTPMKEATLDAKKAVAGSIIFDTLIRLSQGGKNPATLEVYGQQLLSGKSPESEKSVQSTSQADIQRLIQENSALRAELNKALQRLAQPPLPLPVAQPAPQVATPPPAQVFQQAPPPVVKYQPVTPPVLSYTPTQPAPAQRAQEVAAQPIPPAISERERKYGFMNFEQAPPATQEREKRFGFMKSSGEKDVAAMFGML